MAMPWWLLLLLALAMGSGQAGAASGPPIIDLAGGVEEALLTDRLWLLKEAPDQPLTAAEALAAGGWEETNPANLSSAYRPATVWLRGQVRNLGLDTLNRWLVVLPWQLRDVQLFLADADSNAILSHQGAGLGYPRTALEIDTVHPTLPLTLAPGQSRTLLLRVQDRSFLGLTVRSVDPESYAAQQARIRDGYLVFIGFVIAILVVLLLWGDWRFTLASAWLSAIVLFELSYEMPLLLSLWPGLRPHMVSLFTISGALTIAVFALASLVFLELYRHRLWSWLYGLLIGFILIAAFATPLTEHTQLTRWVAVRLTLAFAILWPLSALFGPPRKGPYQLGVLILLTASWLLIVVRILTSTGLVQRIHDDTLVMLYRLTPLCLVLGVILLDRLGRRQLERAREQELLASREAARQALFDRQREENLRLTAAVEEQTRSLRAATLRAEESSQAKSSFLSTVSHELRAPLHDILGYAQLLARQIPAGARDHLGVIQTSANRLLHLIGDILAFSRGEAKPVMLDPAPLSLTRLANHLGEVCRPLAASGDNVLNTRVEIEDGGWVMADEQRLMQVLRNLLENACKFTQGGQIELSITQAAPTTLRAEAAVPDVAAVRAKPIRVLFAVTDTGVGIPEVERDAIFQPFTRLDRYQRVPGLGLGLAIAQQLTTAMGGRIRLQRSQGVDHGSSFRFELCLPHCEPQEDEVTAERAPIGYRGRRRTLLIADDFATSRQYLAECSRAWGFQVLLAEDGAQALARVREADSPPDAALVDQFMPYLDGWGFLRGVRESVQHQDLPVVLISAAPPQRPAAFPLDLDFDGYGMKPLCEARLAQILGEILGIEWEYEEVAAPAPVQDVEEFPSLAMMCSTSELETFRDMVALGQLMGIKRWAQGMADRHPEHEGQWRNIQRLCDQVDMHGLRRLVPVPAEGARESQKSNSIGIISLTSPQLSQGDAPWGVCRNWHP